MRIPPHWGLRNELVGIFLLFPSRTYSGDCSWVGIYTMKFSSGLVDAGDTENMGKK